MYFIHKFFLGLDFTTIILLSGLRKTLHMRTLSTWDTDYGHHLIYGWNSKALRTPKRGHVCLEGDYQHDY